MIHLEEDEALRAAALRTAAALRIARERVEEELLSARRSLEAERKELADAQALAKVGSWRSDLERKTLVWSDETYRIFGMAAGEAGTSYEAFYERVHPDDRALVAAAFDLSVRRHEPYMYEHRLLLADGTLKWVQERCEFFYGDDGRPLRAAGTVQDITERKKAEAVLLRSQQLLRIACRAGRMGGWDIDFVGNTMSWSDEVCAIHGVPAGYSPTMAEAISFYAPEYRDAISRSVAACILDGIAFDLELQIINFSGDRVWIRAIGEAQRDGSGTVTGLGGAFQDISERVSALNALRESDDRFRLVMQATTDVVWDWNLTNDTCWWSDGLETKFGYPAEFSTSSRFWSDNIHPEDQQVVLEGIHAAIRGGDSVWIDEYRFRKADGTYSQVTDKALIEHNNVGAAVRMLGAMIDVTEQRSLEARLEQAQRLSALGHLAANMAHEFNNVLMSIQPFAEVISRVTPETPAAQEAAGHIVQAVRRGKEVTAQILLFTDGIEPVDQPAQITDWLVGFASQADALTGERAVPPSSAALAGRRPKKVLIVDDERSVAEGISMLLESEGLESASVFEGAAAVSAIEEYAPEVVLLDIGLPDISGVEVFKRIYDRWPLLRVILMTGHYSPLDIAAILELPNVGFLQKPFGVDELLTALVVSR